MVERSVLLHGPGSDEEEVVECVRQLVHRSSRVLVTVGEVGAPSAMGVFLPGREEEVTQQGCTHVRMDVFACVLSLAVAVLLD